MCKNREILPLAVKLFGEFETRARNTNQVSLNHSRLREAKQIVHSSFDDQPSMQRAVSDWDPGLRDHHRCVHRTRGFFQESARPGIELESNGEGDLVESMGLYQ